MVGEDGAIDLKSIPTVYFKGNKGCTYTVNHRVSKVFIENCEDCHFIFNGTLMTRTIEAWRCTNLKLSAATEVKTLQLDISRNVAVHMKHPDHFGCAVWQNIQGQLSFSFEEAPHHNLDTSFDHVLEKYPDSKLEIDQFIVRFVDELGQGLQQERGVRLKNGFLSTEREADDWDKRNTLSAERYMNNFLKDGGIHANKKVGEKKIPPNSMCPKCDSGKKYKKCCMNKRELMGVETDPDKAAPAKK